LNREHPTETRRYTIAFLTHPKTSTATIARVCAALAEVAAAHGFRVDEIHMQAPPVGEALPAAARAADAALVVGAGDDEVGLLFATAVLLRDTLRRPAAADMLAGRGAEDRARPVGEPEHAVSGSLTGSSRELGDVLLGLVPLARRSPTIALGGSA
jgi:hypothetical protein